MLLKMYLLINDGATNTSTNLVSLKLSATDNSGVSAYFLSEDNSTPIASQQGWIDLIKDLIQWKQILYLSAESVFGTYKKTVYVWFKDKKETSQCCE